MASDQADGLLTPASIRRQLTKILQSGLFADSGRMTRFLQFAVEETLNGKAQQLKESVIGIHVFDRPSAYDPRIDPIVRVEARRLRLKLRAYYDGDGKTDDVSIELPKGGYAPVFRVRGEKTAAGATQADTVAVLPFTNLGTDSENEFLSDGLTEDLISALTRVSNLRVSAWTSVSRMKGDGDNLDSVRDVLGVTFVLRGSIRKTRDRIRVLAHLIDTSTKQYIWSETFDRAFRDIFAIQDEITRAIVVALQAKLHVRDDRPIRKAQDIDSYQLCLKGRFHARERTAEGLGRSALCFEQATRVDPQSAAAYAGLADTFTLQAEYGFVDGPSFMGKAKTAVERALALDSASAEVHASHGLVLSLYDRAWVEAEAAFRRSLELNASYIPAHHWYATNHLAMLGRFAEAETEIAAALELDPLSHLVLAGQAFIRFLRGDFDGAITIYTEILADDPSFYKTYASMGRTCLHKGEHDRAIQLLQMGLSLGGEVPTMLGVLGQAYGMAGNRLAALDILESLRRISVSRPVPSSCFALVHLGLDEKEAALTWLELGVQRRESSAIGLGVHPAYDGLREEERFKALVDLIIPGHKSYRKMTP